MYNVGAAVQLCGQPIGAPKHGVGAAHTLSRCLGGPCEVCRAAIEAWKIPLVEHGFLPGDRAGSVNKEPLSGDELINAAQQRVSLLRESYSRDDLAQHANLAGGTITRAGRAFISAATSQVKQSVRSPLGPTSDSPTPST